MYVDTTSYLNASYTTSADEEASSDLGQDEFITLLLAQLENQDPLNPVEDTEMLSELAQFSSLEQLTSLNESMDSLVEGLTAVTVNSAIGYIGKEVTASGNILSKGEDGCSTVYYTLPDDAESVTAHVYDADGDIYASVDLGARSEGEYEFQWDGVAYSGSEAADGNYYVAFEAYDANGEYLDVATEVAGTITGITSENGSTQFRLDDGRLVGLLSISSVQAAGTDSADDTAADSTQDDS